MNIKTEEEQIADRLVSIINRSNGFIGDAAVNLNYLMEPFKNKILKDDVQVTMNKHNIKSLLEMLEYYKNVCDIAYNGVGVNETYGDYMQRREGERREAQRLFNK